jgi:bifunctional DNase/RNase
MELLGVRRQLPANTPMVILREGDGDRRRLLPIMIGDNEALAIHTAMEGVTPPRPLTHDLLTLVVQRLGGTLERVLITEIRDHTFYAELHLRTAAGEVVVSCRPSDAVALAVRSQAPVFAEDALLDAEGVEVPEDADGEEEDDEAILDEFRDFLDDVKPEDFGG